MSSDVINDLDNYTNESDGYQDNKYYGCSEYATLVRWTHTCHAKQWPITPSQ